MSKRLTIEEVKKRAKDIGTWEVLDDVYVNTDTKLRCKCTKRGHIHNISGSAIQRGKGCPHCNKENRPTIEEVKKRAKGFGVWEVLDDVYENAHIKLKCKCIKCGSIHGVTGSDIQQGKRCPYCYKKNKLTIEEVKKRAVVKGVWEVLDSIYVDAHTRLKCRCIRCRHVHYVTGDSIQRNTACPYCAKITIEEVKEQAKSFGIWEVLDNVYVNRQIKLKCKCVKCRRIHNVSGSHIQRGIGCPYCNKRRKLTIEKVKKQAKDIGIWKVLDDVYINSGTKLKCECIKCCLVHYVRAADIRLGTGCPRCNKSGNSKWEKTIRKFLDLLCVSYISNDRTQLTNPNTNYNLELDMWFPDLNKAIECNGIYWHGKKRAIKNDKIKKQLCKDQGIDLLVITDKEWKDDTDKCKTKIKNFVTGE